MPRHEQLDIFTEKLDTALLVASDSSRAAFYRIWIERALDDVRIVKASGIKGRVLDRRIWAHSDLQSAEKAFSRRIKSKTNPNRKSPRKYRLIKNAQLS